MNEEKRPLDPQEEIKETVGTEQENQDTSAAVTDTDASETSAEQEPVSEETASDKKKEANGKVPAKKSGMKAFFKSSKFRHGGMATVFTAGFLVVVILINLVVSLIGERFPSINIDLSQNSMNTLSEDAIEVVDSVTLPTTITILLDEETASSNTSYSQVVNLAEKMRERNSNISIAYQDLDADPTFTTKYPNDNLVAGGVIVETEKRYRVLQYSDLFQTQYDYQTGQSNSFSYVDSALASAVSQANADTLPIIAFATGHNEALDTTALKDMLSGSNFEVVDFNIMTEEIPENADMVIIGTPTTDYTQAEIEKLDAYLDERYNTRESSRSVMFTFDPGQSEMPNLSTFLEEWGISVSQDVIYEQDTQNMFMPTPSAIMVDQDTELDLGTDSEYNTLVTINSAPIEFLFDAQNSVVTYPLLKTKETACLVNSDNVENYNLNDPSASDIETNEYLVAGVGQKSIKINGEYYTANVFAMGSSQMFVSTILNTNTFGNGQYTLDLIKYATDTANSDSAIYSAGVQTNVMDINMSVQLANILGIGVFTLLPLIGLLLAGIVVYLKRRHL